jgi:hypothetical protein
LAKNPGSLPNDPVSNKSDNGMPVRRPAATQPFCIQWIIQRHHPRLRLVASANRESAIKLADGCESIRRFEGVFEVLPRVEPPSKPRLVSHGIRCIKGDFG